MEAAVISGPTIFETLARLEASSGAPAECKAILDDAESRLVRVEEISVT